MLDLGAELPGASAGPGFASSAFDGVNTGSATYNVPKKLPSTIVINSPQNGAADPILLSSGTEDETHG